MEKIKNIACYLIAIVALCTLFVSCDEDAITQNYVDNSVEKTYQPYVPITMNEDFWNSLDSINNAQIQLRTKATSCVYTNATRVNDDLPLAKNDLEFIKCNNRIGCKLADQIGKVAGGYGGKWLGGAAGAALTENPLGYFAGKKLGQFVGRHVGAIVASKFAEFLNNNNTSNKPAIEPGQRVDGNIEIGGSIGFPGVRPSKPTTSEDSIGIIHNKVMTKLSQNSSKYKTGGNINVNLMYTDCVNYLKQEGIYNDTIANDLEYRKSIINIVKEMGNYSVDCYNGKISGNEVLDKGITLLKSKYNISDEEAETIKRLSISTTNTATGMSQTQAQDYADAVSFAIQNSNISPEQKVFVSSYVYLTVSSSLYWDNINLK